MRNKIQQGPDGDHLFPSINKLLTENIWVRVFICCIFVQTKNNIMGYTHYWKLKTVPENYKEQFPKVITEVQMLIERMPTNSETAGGHFNEDKVILRGGDGTGKPDISKERICFNGDGKKGLDHETFHIEFNQEPFEFDFCKTARKPYDQAVCLCLLSLANHIDGFEFSSDGDKEDWQPAIDFYLNYNGNYVSKNLERSLANL